MPFKYSVLPMIPLAFAALAGCSMPTTAVDAVPKDAEATTLALAEVKDALTAPPVPQPEVEPAVQFTGLGLAQVGTQPGGSLNEKRLMAIRAARMDALRDLTEQIHGIQITSNTTLRDQVLRSDQINGIVSGEIRGAQTQSITPKGTDGYEVKMTLNPDTVRYIVRAARQAG